MVAKSANTLLTERIADFIDDPLGYVMFAFPWEDNTTIQMVELEPKYADRYGLKYGPDKWACEMLEQLGEEIRDRGFNGKDAVDAIRFSTASGHGIGKSAMSSWIIKFNYQSSVGVFQLSRQYEPLTSRIVQEHLAMRRIDGQSGERGSLSGPSLRQLHCILHL